MPRTILVVEDNPITRKMMQVALEASGDLVLSAADGRTALQLAAEQPVDLVLQDLILPDMDGIELARSLREVAQTRDVPIVVLSGLASKVEEARQFAAGFNEVLFKPIEPSRLQEVIRHLCPAADPSPANPGRGRTILLVEDDATQRKINGLRLEEQGFRVQMARDGLEALEAARRRTPAFEQVIDSLLASLAGPPPPKPAANVGALKAEYSSRLVRQLEQQATLNQSLMQQAASRTAQRRAVHVGAYRRRGSAPWHSGARQGLSPEAVQRGSADPEGARSARQQPEPNRLPVRLP